jgi:hypothetical protein
VTVVAWRRSAQKTATIASADAAVPIAPQPSATAATSDDPDAAASSVAQVATTDPSSELTVVCHPACGLVMIDGKRVSDPAAPARLRPGPHGIGVSRARFAGQWKRVMLKAGEKQKVAFTLIPLPVPPPRPKGK